MCAVNVRSAFDFVSNVADIYSVYDSHAPPPTRRHRALERRTKTGAAYTSGCTARHAKTENMRWLCSNNNTDATVIAPATLRNKAENRNVNENKDTAIKTREAVLKQHAAAHLDGGGHVGGMLRNKAPRPGNRL